MSEPEDFLSRWSRRKQEVAREEDALKPETVAEGQDGEQDSVEKNSPREKEGKPTDAAKEPAFDLSKLPSIESITAETDIRPFLAAGVPMALRNAALRRVWVADPKIRDFIEMAENQWDFTGAAEVPGFDFSPPTGDVRRFVAEMFGEKTGADESSPVSTASNERSEVVRGQVPSIDEPQAHRNVIESRPIEAAQAPAFEVRPTEKNRAEPATIEQSAGENIAPQNNDAARNAPMKISRRSHGGALPK